ncbi:MAG TPA: rod shape-determining protein RodA [Nitrospirota bacterium]|jgi:rod shape determining protein RodA
MARDKRGVRIDWTFFTALFALVLAGLAVVYSATFTMDRGSHSLFLKQVIWLGAGFICMGAALFTDYRRLERWGYILYTVAVLMLVAVLAMGRTGMGAQRWLPLGPFQFQPSEMAKLFLIVALAKYFSEDGLYNGHTLRDLVKPFIMAVVPVLLVVKQPDLGTGLVLLFIFGAMVVAAGIKFKSFLILATTAALSAPVAWGVFWGHLKDYQRKRILVFLDPESDPSGAGYHIIQSKIAVGSGALAGKGYLNGTQSQLSFLPERHTDFIFSVLSEEWGFVGSLFVILLFLFIILWGLETAGQAKDRFGSMLAVGIVAMVFFHTAINISMTIGIMPVVGVPLPLVSYGGTSALTTLAALGLLASVNMRRFKLFY